MNIHSANQTGQELRAGHGSCARDDARLAILLMGARAADWIPAASMLHIGEWLGWPAWLREGTALAGEEGPLPPMITRADDIMMMANIVDRSDAFALIEDMLVKPRSALSLVGELAVMHGPDLGASFDLVVRGLALRNIWVRLETAVDGEDYVITVRPVWPMGLLFSTFALCALTLLQRAIVSYRADRLEGMAIATQTAGLPEAQSALAAFRCPVAFSCDGEALRFPREWLSGQNPYYDPLVWDVAKAKFAALEHELSGTGPADPLRAFISDHLSATHRVPRLKQAAAHIGMSSRTIVRVLARQNTSFHKLVEAERKARALALIGDTSLSLAEVAEALGFSDMSSFGRSFRTWFGNTPGNLRKLSLQKQGGGEEGSASKAA